MLSHRKQRSQPNKLVKKRDGISIGMASKWEIWLRSPRDRKLLKNIKVHTLKWTVHKRKIYELHTIVIVSFAVL